MLLVMATIVIPQTALGQQSQTILLHRSMQKSNQDVQKEKLARYYYLNQHYEKAAELFGELYKKRHSYYYYTYYLNSLLYLKNYDEALKIIKKQSRKYSGNYRYLIDNAYVYDRMGKKKKANRIINKIIANLPENPSLVNQIANALQSKGYVAQALAVYNKAINRSGNHYSYAIERANTYRLSGDYGKMFDAWLDYLNEKPNALQMIKNRMQSVLNFDVDDNLQNILRKKLLLRSQHNPKNFAYSDLLLWFSMQTKDFETAYRQACAIDRRFGGQEDAVYNLAKIALSNKNYVVAEKAFAYLKNKGVKSAYYAKSYAGWFIAKNIEIQNDTATTLDDYRTLAGEGRKLLGRLGTNSATFEVAMHLAKIEAFYLDKAAEAEKLLKETLKTPELADKNKARAKLLLGDVLLLEKKVWDASLLYSQVEMAMKNEPLGHEAKFKNAMLFYYVGEFDWAQTRLSILKAATSKLISNDAIEMSMFIKNILDEDTLGFSLRTFGAADLLLAQNKPDSAMELLDSLEKHPAGEVTAQFVLFKKAGIFKSEKRYAEADSVYGLLVKLYPESIKADDALFDEAEIKQDHLNQAEQAKALYLRLMKEYPESIFAGEARHRFRTMKTIKKKN